MLNHEQAKAFYDRFGEKQDAQAFYEDAATEDLIDHAEFGDAHEVFEMGCGTGRFAESLLQHHLPLSAHYHGIDLSETMVELARKRLGAFDTRVRVTLSNGTMALDAHDSSIDRVITNYVLDLLSTEDIVAFLREASRVLTSDGRLCLVGLTPGRGVLAGLVSTVWKLLHRIRPQLVGGCRPLSLIDFLDQTKWTILHRRVLMAYGISSEVIVARPKSLEAGSGSREAV